MKKLITWLMRWAIVLYSFVAPHVFGATTVISALPATNVIGTNDLIVLDTSLGGGTYTTRTVTYQQFMTALRASLGNPQQITNGGTAATNAVTARANLGAAGLTDNNAMSGSNAFSGNNSFTASNAAPGWYFVPTNAQGAGSPPVVYLSNFTTLYFGTGGSVYNNPNHGPADEVQFTFGSRVSFLPGYGQQHNGAIQIGSGSFGVAQGADCPVYLTIDSGGTTGNILGYGSLFDYQSSYYNGTMALSRYRSRAEGEDTNGTVRLMSYFLQESTGISNPLIGQSPGATGPVELWAGPFPDSVGVVQHGRLTTDATNANMTGTNFGVDFDAVTVQDLTPTGAVNLTNVPPLWPRTNQDDLKTLHLFGSIVPLGISFPTNWTFTTNSPAPTTIPASNMIRVKVEREIFSNATNYWATADTFPVSVSEDTNVAQFVTASGITNTTEILAVNNLVIALKTTSSTLGGSLWSHMDAIYPFLGSTTTRAKWNLVNTSLFTGTFTGSMTVNGNGITGDASSAYMDTGFNPNTASSPNYTRNSGSMGVYLKTVGAAASFENAYMGACDSTARADIWNNSGTFFIADGADSLANNQATIADTTGLLMMSRQTSTTGALYQAGTGSSGTWTATTGVPNLTFLVMATRDGGIGFYQNATIGIAFIGAGFSTADDTALNTIILNFVTQDGRQ